MFTRRKFLAVVAGSASLPFAPRVAASLPAVDSSRDPDSSAVITVSAVRNAVRKLQKAEVLEVEVVVDTSQPRQLLEALRKEIEETDALLFSAQSRQAQVLR
jgi:hypothetical protein